MPKNKVQPVEVSLTILAQYCNPYKGCWVELSKPVTKLLVRKILIDGLERRTNTTRCELPSDEVMRFRHAQKIGWFVKNGFKNPIDIDVGVPELSCCTSWLVSDGNHRLAAALFLNKKTIRANVYGSLNYAKELGILT